MHGTSPKFTNASIAICILLLIGPIACAGFSPRSDYDPLSILYSREPRVLDMTVRHASGSRKTPIRVYLPAAGSGLPVVLFSHGLGGSRKGSAYLARHWAARGYLCVFLQHPGSDESVWKDEPVFRRLRALKQAATPRNFLLRVKDVTATLDRLEQWNRAPAHPLHDKMDLTKIGMSGHSFGAVTAQALSGQSFFQGRVSLTDPRIEAALILSPSKPRRERNIAGAFREVTIPWMLMTGTHDVAIIGNADLQSRLQVFPALPPGNKYELVLDGAEHSAFADHGRPFDKRPRNPNHHRSILALSTAFWDAYLRGNQSARDWLDGTGPASVLEERDRLRKK